MKISGKTDANESPDHRVLLPLLRDAKGTLRDADSCSLALFASAEACKEWDSVHGQRVRFCDTLAEIAVFMTAYEKLDATIPADETISEFFRCCGEGNETLKVLLGSIDRKLWETVFGLIVDGIDNYVKSLADSLDVRPEVIELGCSAFKSTVWNKAGLLENV